MSEMKKGFLPQSQLESIGELQTELGQLKQELEDAKNAVSAWVEIAKLRDQQIDELLANGEAFDELLKLVAELDYTISCTHLDMGGNHKYALSHKSNGVISKLKLFMSEAINKARGNDDE